MPIIPAGAWLRPGRNISKTASTKPKVKWVYGMKELNKRAEPVFNTSSIRGTRLKIAIVPNLPIAILLSSQAKIAANTPAYKRIVFLSF